MHWGQLRLHSAVAVECGIAGIPLDRWYKFIIPLFGMMVVLEVIFIIIAVMINIGHFKLLMLYFLKLWRFTTVINRIEYLLVLSCWKVFFMMIRDI